MRLLNGYPRLKRDSGAYNFLLNYLCMYNASIFWSTEIMPAFIGSSLEGRGGGACALSRQ